jgi:hydroxymethylbilane synthase
MTRRLRLGTRGSALAMAQSGIVARAIEAAAGVAVDLVPIKTRGDAITDRPLELVGGKGLFTKEIEQALLQHQVDVAVHSMKDLPAEEVDGLVIAAIPTREDPRDALVGGKLADLPPGAVIGTGSARRRLQILGLRPDLTVRGIRGNVDTRIGKQHAGEFDSVVLALAGLSRLGRAAEATDVLPVDVMIPAPGQGALAIQCRANDGEVRKDLLHIHDFATAVCVNAERAFLIALGAGCSVPAAGHARLAADGWVEFLGLYADEHGEVRRVVRRAEAEDSLELGKSVALELMG